MSRITLRGHTTAQNLFLLRENMKALRGYARAMDPDKIDRLTRSAELCSTTIKSLLGNMPDPKHGEEPDHERADLIDISAVATFLDAVDADRRCPLCGAVWVP